MKNFTFNIFWTILLTFGISCNSSQTVKNSSTNDSSFYPIDLTGDYSKSAYDAISLIKEEINSEKFQEIKVTIISTHNGTYGQVSKIKKEAGSILIEKTETNDNGKVLKKFKKYEFKQFSNILDELLIKSNDEIVIAGTFQNIIIDNGQSQKKFNTRKAWGLINAL